MKFGQTAGMWSMWRPGGCSCVGRTPLSINRTFVTYIHSINRPLTTFTKIAVPLAVCLAGASGACWWCSFWGLSTWPIPGAIYVRILTLAARHRPGLATERQPANQTSQVGWRSPALCREGPGRPEPILSLMPPAPADHLNCPDSVQAAPIHIDALSTLSQQ